MYNYVLAKHFPAKFGKHQFTCKIMSPWSGAFTERLGNSISSTLSTEKKDNTKKTLDKSQNN